MQLGKLPPRRVTLILIEAFSVVACGKGRVVQAAAAASAAAAAGIYQYKQDQYCSRSVGTLYAYWMYSAKLGSEI